MIPKTWREIPGFFAGVRPPAASTSPKLQLRREIHSATGLGVLNDISAPPSQNCGRMAALELVAGGVYVLLESLPDSPGCIFLHCCIRASFSLGAGADHTALAARRRSSGPRRNRGRSGAAGRPVARGQALSGCHRLLPGGAG